MKEAAIAMLAVLLGFVVVHDMKQGKLLDRALAASETWKVQAELLEKNLGTCASKWEHSVDVLETCVDKLEACRGESAPSY